MTLLELTIVIVVVLLFLGMTWIGASVWKTGSDRANCVINIRQVQMAVRGYANNNNLLPGADISPVNLTSQVIGPDTFLPNTPDCPGNGTYTMGGNTVPTVGTLYMTCSLSATEQHVPADFGSW